METCGNGILDLFGRNVFNLRTMREYLSAGTYRSLRATMCAGKPLNSGIADEVAEAMKTWAMSRGATHFSHWFQPLTGATAEKHESFLVPGIDGCAIAQFSGKELIKGEPDASSFPSGGLRATFEARGYTAWDPTSPAFLKESDSGATLCIPTAFFGYHGEALDTKTPLLRSIEAISSQVIRMGKLFGIKKATQRPSMSLGAEQEYFLVDRKLNARRPDLLQTGRTLFGRRPAKHQQMGDHYYGAIKSRVLAFMEDLDRELWELGVPSRTRHNEVCPGQFEVAPVYEDMNLAVDHNMIVMQTLHDVATRHGFTCLLHEKPYAGVNGSGKHNNWSITGPDGKNWLNPGENPHENAIFLTVICALMKAIDNHADILRASVATAGNDHRLGAHEAPPAILSMFLGDQLTEIIDQMGRGEASSTREKSIIHLGVSSLPHLPRDTTDRNRTSPFAFTGNKFEFRAVGSNQSCAGPCMVLNTIVAEALDDICTALENAVADGKDFNETLESLLGEIARQHRRIVFNGDNYTSEWHVEAAKRGLPHVHTTPEAITAYTDLRTVALFEKYGVLSRRELESRYEICRNEYEGLLKIEAACAVEIVRTMIVPAALQYQRDVAATIGASEAVAPSASPTNTDGLFEGLRHDIENVLASVKRLEQVVDAEGVGRIPATMEEIRTIVNSLEHTVPRNLWPLPSYADMMFMI